jgi:hypothetical protein
VTRLALSLLSLSLSVAACDPALTTQTAAPPGRTALFEDVTGFWGTVQSYKLEISQGTAIAVTCSRGGPCTDAALTADNPALVDARRAALGTLVPNGLNGNLATESAFVIFGKAPGTTHLHLHAKQGDRDIAVTVVAQPQPRS